MAYSNLSEMFYKTCGQYGDRAAMMYKEVGNYRSLSFNEIEKRVTAIANGLASLGVNKGDKVILLAENSKEWAFCDYAALSNGAATVPVYATLLPAQVAYIINDSDARIVIASNAEQFEKILAVQDRLKMVEKYVVFDGQGVPADKAMTLEQLMSAGEQYRQEHPDELQKRSAAVGRDDLATIIYTSGTTGEPKGVMLTHGNLLSNVEASLRALPVFPDDIFLSFLPLSHVFERMVGHFLAFYAGATIAYAESVEAVPQNLQEVRPTLMASVPRLFEKIYAKVVTAVEEGPGIKKKLFNWAIGVGREVTALRQQQRPLSGGLSLKFAIANKLVFSKLKERVGGRIRFFASGGAPLSREIGEFFTAAGLQILEGYGLTETSPVITVNRLEKFKFGTVGLPIDNVEVKIADDGEILTRGPHVMKGYYKKEADTREAIDDDQWFHTGDIGIFDEDGFLVITDRKKNIIVTAGGKNVAPQKIENMLITSRYIEQILVIGDKRKFCSALIVPSFENLEKFAAENGMAGKSHEELCKDQRVIDLINNEVQAANSECASYETIKKFILIAQPFSLESGELTPSLKVKRKIVEKNYAQEIDALYKV